MNKLFKTKLTKLLFFLLFTVFIINSCTKDCNPNKEGQNCLDTITSKHIGTWTGTNSCEGARQINIDLVGDVSVEITSLFKGQVYPIKGAVNFTTITFEPNQTVVDGIVLLECSAVINPDKKITIIYNLQDNTTSPPKLSNCTFTGQKSGDGIQNLPVLQTLNLEIIDSNTIETGGQILSNGGSLIKATGVCWGTSPNPKAEGSNVTKDNLNPNNKFISQISGLKDGETYYIRAYAINDAGTGYGNELIYYKAACFNNLCIGQDFQGGRIAYFFKPGDPGYDPITPHGYIIYPNDLSDASWGCSNLSIGNTSKDEFTGQENTDKIVFKCNEPNIAAVICKNLGNGWFLPSLDEFDRAVQNLGSQGWSQDYYWTSSEENSATAWTLKPANLFTQDQGYKQLLSKYNSAKVRPFKKF